MKRLFDLERFVADCRKDGIMVNAFAANTEEGMINIALFPPKDGVSELLFGQYHEEIMNQYWEEVE